jgi:GT2 family glycosyltransferase
MRQASGRRAHEIYTGSTGTRLTAEPASPVAQESAGPLETVSFVIPTFRRPDALATTLAAVARTDFPRDQLEVIVVDDDANTDTRAVVERAGEQLPGIRYLSQQNRGAARARNLGAGEAQGDVLVFLDDDIVVEPEHVQRHLAALGDFERALVNGHWEFSPDVAAQLESTPFGRFRIGVERWVKDGIAKTPLDDGRLAPETVTAANLSLERELFWRLGGFDETFPFAGYEDQEFSHRATQAGCQLVYDPAIRLLHNDRRVTLRQFCARQERGAMTAVLMAAKHPAEYGRRPLITENSPLARDDPPRVALKKIAKRVLSVRPILAAVHAALDLLERVRPNSSLLRRGYWGMCGLYIYRGVRRGLDTTPVPRTDGRAL